MYRVPGGYPEGTGRVPGGSPQFAFSRKTPHTAPPKKLASSSARPAGRSPRHVRHREEQFPHKQRRTLQLPVENNGREREVVKPERLQRHFSLDLHDAERAERDGHHEKAEFHKLGCSTMMIELEMEVSFFPTHQLPKNSKTVDRIFANV